MRKKIDDIKMIVWGLALLYAVSLTIYTEYYQIEELRSHALVLMLLFGILLVGAVALSQFRDWGRKIIVFVNLVLVIYIIYLAVAIKTVIPVSYAILGAVIVLFFNQNNVKERIKMRRNLGGWKSVLLVDDDETLIRIVRPILLSHGYSVLVANSGEEGLRVAKKQKPNLILLDVILPGIKGRDVCRQIKSDNELKHIPIIFLTSKDSQDDVQAEMAAGAQAHLSKPVKPKELLDTVYRFIS